MTHYSGNTKGNVNSASKLDNVNARMDSLFCSTDLGIAQRAASRQRCQHTATNMAQGSYLIEDDGRYFMYENETLSYEVL